MKIFVDTNIFLRFLTKDDSGQSTQAEEILRAASNGKQRIVVGPPVFFELAWTLKRTYRVAPEQVLTMLEAVASLPGLDLLDEATVRAALSMAREHQMEFADAYIAATLHTEGLDALATFNTKHFRKTGIRILP